MKKILAVAVATEVEAEGAVQHRAVEAGKPLNQSPPYHCPGHDHADQPYLLLPPYGPISITLRKRLRWRRFRSE
jgi:hypothetical protein